jgi:hypothetical protein
LTELKKLRKEEAARGAIGKLGLRDEKLWRHISEALLKNHGINRSLAGCKYYWGRFGRARSSFDERVNKDDAKLSTSVQTKKK